MTICFFNNSFKYEAEAVMKLFLPLQTFDFLFEEYPADEVDVCAVKRIQSLRDENGYILSVSVTLKGEKREMFSERSGEFSDTEDEAELCRSLYKIMQELTGITPAWGCLTGIRPVKKVNRLLDEGYKKDEIFSILKKEYFVSDEKLELAYRTALAQSGTLRALDKRSYSLYISIPFCPSRCSYCSFVSHSIEKPEAKKLIDPYVVKLREEIKQISLIAAGLDLRLDTIYIGGGTPSVLSPEQLEAVMDSVKKSFDISKIREYNVEAGRPDTITEKKLEIIRDFGATRISVNPQTMNNNVLKAIGRRHTAGEAEEAFRAARRLGFDNINMDTIAGLPTDTVDGFRHTIETLCRLDPESITIHTLTVKRASRLFSEQELEVDSRTAEMVDFGQKKLLETGYIPYYLYRQKNTVENLENVGFAKQGHECLYNIYIMEEAQTILAAGAAGSTKLVNTETGKIERLFNYKFPYEYVSRYDKMMEKKSDIIKFFNNI
ncbi:MAG: coproporphyrinogen dehydrogenase HemZ [Oscillospiraceae bacterium]|nr:coproporphyrinogen dehydrogenase HemZ [Oscillospiraceae bacterium]